MGSSELLPSPSVSPAPIEALQTPSANRLSLGAVIAALSQALDLSTGQPLGHSMRSCLLGMRIASEIGLSPQAQSNLFYASLLKDCGCSINSSPMFHTFGADELKAKRDVKLTDWTKVSWETLQFALTHVATGKPFVEKTRLLFLMAANSRRDAHRTVKTRCERGANLVLLMGLPQAVSVAIQNLDEHWDGAGLPDGFHRTEIPILSRIMLLAQTLEVFLRHRGAGAALQVANGRSARWFDPNLIGAVNSLEKRNGLWTDVLDDRLFALCLESEKDPIFMNTADADLDRISNAFAGIVDAKSPYTFNHSLGVANAAVAIARTLALPRERILLLRNAALLHDLGKLGISNAILEKPSSLDPSEFEIIKSHPVYTWKILNAIPGFAELSEIAGSHHEKLDGSGYFRGLTAPSLPLESRILAVADTFDALSAKRPYRDGLPREKVFSILRSDAPHRLDATCVEALHRSGVESNQTYMDLTSLNLHLTAAGSIPC